MTSPTSGLRTTLKWCAAVGVVAIVLVNATGPVDAQGLVKGVEQGAREGNKAAGPVGGVLGGAIGGVVGVVGGVVSTVTGGNNNSKPVNDKAGQAPANDKQGNTKAAKGVKGANTKEAKAVQVLTQEGAPQLTAEQIVSNRDPYFAALDAADAALKERDVIDVSKMEELLSGMLAEQLKNAYEMASGQTAASP